MSPKRFFIKKKTTSINNSNSEKSVIQPKPEEESRVTKTNDTKSIQEHKEIDKEALKSEENLQELSRSVQESGEDSVAEVIISIAKNSTDLNKKTEARKISRLILKDIRVDNFIRCDALDILLDQPDSDDISSIAGALFETEYYFRCNDFNAVLISSLQKIGKSSVPAMVEALENKENPNDTRVRAVKVLGGIDSRDAKKAVKKAAQDDNMNVRVVAESALRNWGN